MLALLTNDVPWPAHNGGRARLVGLVQVLGALDDVDVLVPVNGHRPVEVPAPAAGLPPCRRSRVSALVGPGPRLARGLLGPAARAEVERRAAAARALVVSHSFLAAGLRTAVPLVVDFPNIERERQRSAGGVVGRLEAAKAALWEPRVARRADLCLAVDAQDAAALRDLGARRVAVLPNAADVPLAPPSPVAGDVLAVADWTYEPNRRAAAAVLDLGVPVRFVGRGSEELPGGLGFVPDLDPVYAAAALVVAPATSGAGTQLKVVEAVCRGRVVVTTPFGARSLPPAARPHCEVGDLGAGIRALLADPAERHRREAALAVADLPRTWAAAGAEARAALAALLAPT